MNASNENAVQATIDDLKALVRDAEKALAGAGDQADEKIAELRDRMKAALAGSRATFDRARASAQEQLGRCDDYVRAHPYQSIGVAAAFGVLLGLVVSRRIP